jgi:hypothetical protein
LIIGSSGLAEGLPQKKPAWLPRLAFKRRVMKKTQYQLIVEKKSCQGLFLIIAINQS